MEKEKKKISCSYAFLVIILFAALAFVVDYAVIERKMNKCNCPKCEAITNNEEKEESITNNENSNEHVNEEKKYSYEDVAGHYRYSDNNVSDDFYFYENGTVIYYGINEFGPGGYLGSYYIEQNKIMTSILFEYYNEDGKLYYKPNNASLGSGNNFEVRDVNSLYAPGSRYMFQRNNNESMNPDLFVEKIVNSEIIYGSLLNSGEPRS